MSHSLREQWAHFAAQPSGQRFQSRYRAQRAQAGGLLRKVLIVSAGVLIMLIGFGMLVLPGPGLLVLIVGGAFIAEESLFVARRLIESICGYLDAYMRGSNAAPSARRAENPHKTGNRPSAKIAVFLSRARSDPCSRFE